MVTFRNNSNNNRRTNFRRNDRSFKSNVERQKFNSNFSNNENFKRKLPGRNNHNASKLIEKYNDLAREALSNGDKILSENYLQHADHFTRILNEREAIKKDKIDEKKENISNNISEIIDKTAEHKVLGEGQEESKSEKSSENQLEVN